MIRLLNLNRFYTLLLSGCIFSSISFAAQAQTDAVSTSVTQNSPLQTADAYAASAPAQTASLEIIQAVNQSVQWHPSIAEAVGLLYQRQQEISIARAGYYPRIQGGLRTGYDNTYDESKSTQALVLSVSQMLYDFGKVANTVKAAEAGVALGEANLLYTIDQIARRRLRAGLFDHFQKEPLLALGTKPDPPFAILSVKGQNFVAFLQPQHMR